MNSKTVVGSLARPERIAMPLLASAMSALLLVGCSDPDTGAESPEADTDRQSAFRIRTDFNAPLNADTGWAADTNQPATVLADEPFRVRFEVEALKAGDTERRYQLEVRRNGGIWEPLGAENFPQPAKELAFDFEAQPEDSLSALWQVPSDDTSGLSWQAGEEGGHLQLEADDEALLALGRYQTTWDPLEFAVDLRLPESDAARGGVVFGYENPDNHLRVDVQAGEGIQVIRISGGAESILATHPFDVKNDDWFELKLIMEDQSLTVEYDDEALVFTEQLKRSIPASVAGLYVPQGERLDVQALVVEGLPRTPRTS